MNMSSYKRRLAVSTTVAGRIGWGGTRTPPVFRPTQASLGWVRPVNGVMAVAAPPTPPIPAGAPPIEIEEPVAVLDLPGAVPCAPAGLVGTAGLELGGIGYTTAIVQSLDPANAAAQAEVEGVGFYMSCDGADLSPRNDRGFLLAAGAGTWRRRGAGAGVVSAVVNGLPRRVTPAG